MQATKVSCPHCHGTLKSSRPLPAGATVQCLKCGNPFTVSAPTAVAAPATAAALTATPFAIGSAPIIARRSAAQGNRALMLTLILGGLLLFLGAGAAVAIYCFSAMGTNPATTVADN